MRYRILTILTLFGTSVQAQQSATAPAGEPPEVTALNTCVALVQGGRAKEAEAPGKAAEALYQKRVAANPRDVLALVGLARAKGQCLIPSANIIGQGSLSSDAMELLEQALEIQPDHWVARYVLASIAYRSPSFLGRGKVAAKEFDELLRRQGDRTDNPMYARVFELRGMQLSRAGQADSARALWARGAKLFPADSALGALAPKAPSMDMAPDSAVPPGVSLAAVRVVAAATPPSQPLPSVQTMDRGDILMAPGGTADVLQSVQMQPGATRVTEGSDVYTRGGDVSETSLLVNGGRMLSLARFESLNGSLFGALEPWVVKSVTYSSGGFSARYGNALSGVLDIETDGRPRERQMRAGLSLVQASGTMRLAASKKVGGWVSGRASHVGALLATHGRTAEFDGAPRSEEIVGSLIVNPSGMSELRATAIVERDESRGIVAAAGWEGPFSAAGDSRAILLSSRWLSSSAPVVLRGNIAGSTRASDWGFGVLSRERDEGSLLARVDAEWEARANLTLRGGVEQGSFTRHERGTLPETPSVAPGAPAGEMDARTSANQIGGYAEAQLTYGAVKFTAGMRADQLPGESDATLDPRVGVSAKHGAWTARASGGLFHQGRWRAAQAIPDPGTPSGTPRSARHALVGLDRDGSFATLRAEAYLKQYSDYAPFGSGPSIASARARGVDVIAQRAASGPVTGWLAYSLLDGDARLVDGSVVRSAFDVTHSLTMSATASINSDWSIGSTIRYGTGAPRTPIIAGEPQPDGFIAPVYGSLMSERLPSYARLDVRLMRFIQMPGTLLTTFVEVINATDRRNVSGMTYDAAYTTRRPMHFFFAHRTIVAGGEFQFR